MKFKDRCIYNGNYVGIEAFTTYQNGRLINVPQKIEQYRKLAKSRQLFCDCGCGRNVTIVAGEKMSRTQHFRILSGQNDLNLPPCHSTNESWTTIISKSYIKCWLDKIWSLTDGDVAFRVPINNITEENRRFEFTHYVKSHNFGVCYEKKNAKLNDEKIEILTNHMKDQMLYITDISNGDIKEQYPEYAIKIQSFQNFCALLNIKDGNDITEATLKIIRYEETWKHTWYEIDVCEAPLLSYQIDAHGELVLNMASINTLVSQKVTEFLKKDTFEREAAKRKEEERQKALQTLIEKHKKEHLDRECAEAKERANAEAAQQKQKEIENIPLEIFLKHYPKTNTLYSYLHTLLSIEGVIYSRNSNGKLVYDKIKITIKSLDYDKFGHCITITSTYNQRISLYIIEKKGEEAPISYSSYGYQTIYLTNINVQAVIPHFQSMFKCQEKKYDITSQPINARCTMEFDCPHKKENDECGLPNSICGFREIL